MQKNLIFLLLSLLLLFFGTENLYAVNSESKTVQIEKTEIADLPVGEKIRHFHPVKILRSLFKKNKPSAAAASSSPIHPLAKWSLILGLSSVFFLGFFTGIPALVLGLIALRRIKESGGFYRGRGMAITGIIIGSLWVFALLILIFLLTTFGI